MMARMRREDEARRARRDQITTYGLVAVIVTFGGARYAGHRSIERACLALLGAFGPRRRRPRRRLQRFHEYRVNGVDAGRERDRLRHTQVALAAMNAYSESIMQLPEPDSDDEDLTTATFMRGVWGSSDSEDDKNILTYTHASSSAPRSAQLDL